MGAPLPIQSKMADGHRNVGIAVFSVHCSTTFVTTVQKVSDCGQCNDPFAAGM